MISPYSLEGIDKNAFAIIGYVTDCLKSEGYTKDDAKTYQHDAMSGDYEHLVKVSQDVISKCNNHHNKF